MPNVAVLTAVETVNPAMQSTLDAAALTVMNKRGQIKDCIVDGPLALDNAISKKLLNIKALQEQLQGKQISYSFQLSKQEIFYTNH